MSLIAAHKISKSYGINTILNDVSLHIEEGERIGIVGPNGSGKTTLLGILSGELPCDEGAVSTAKNMKVGYLKQVHRYDKDRTLRQEIDSLFEHIYAMEAEIEDLGKKIEEAGQAGDQEAYARHLADYDKLQHKYKDAGGFLYRSEIKGILASMAIGQDDMDKKIMSLSGGEKMRFALACILLMKPDILLMDEPTNHLDIGTIKWLEQYLQAYRGTLIIVSHDRYFLDKIVGRIFHVEHHSVRTYKGNYSAYVKIRKKEREDEYKHYLAQQKEIRRQEDLIRSYKQRGTEKLAKRAASRERMLEKLDLIERPESDRDSMKIRFEEGFESGNDVIFAENLKMAFGENQLFEGVKLDIKRGEKIAILGANGIGKTTLLKLLMGSLFPVSGRIKLGYNVKIGYYDQEQRLLNESATVIDEIHNVYTKYTQGELRNILGRFLFRGDEVFKQVSKLSGGEKARLSLLKLMMSGANVLLMDEPTNHLDIVSRDMFEEALMEFPGTAIIVSHDRYLLSKVPDRILELKADGIVEYLGKYDYYEEKKQSIDSGRQYLKDMADRRGVDQEGASSAKADSASNSTSNSVSGLSSKEERRLQKQEEARVRRTQRQRQAIEVEIEEKEEEQLALEEEMCSAAEAGRVDDLTQLSQKLDELKQELENLYDRWADIAE